MVVAIFRSRVRDEHADEYYRRADELAEIARTMPGFISWKGFSSEDGERVSIHEWASADALYVCESPRQSLFQRSTPEVTG